MAIRALRTPVTGSDHRETDEELVALALRLLWALDAALADTGMRSFDLLSSGEREQLRSALGSAYSILDDTRKKARR